MNILKKTILAMLPICAFAAGCTTEYDDDGFRSGAIEVQLGEITSDEIYPSAGDEIDWKMVFLPSPGDIIVNTWWDDPAGVFNVEVGIYDRFGIPVKVDRRQTAASTLEVRTFVPESGLHYVKVKAESGQSIYSINIGFETNYDGFVAPTTAPTFESYIDFEAETAGGAGSAGGAAAGSAGGAAGSGSAGGAADSGAAPAVPAGAVALPTAAAGGAVLPTAAAGGIASASGGDSGPTIVRGSTVGQSYQSDSTVKTINNSTSAVSNEKAAIKPICDDIKGRHKKVDAEPLAITSLKKGTKIKLNVGHKDGIQDGAVGDIYVDGKILEGARFKVDQIQEKYCFVITNAPSSEVKKASRFVVKTPE